MKRSGTQIAAYLFDGFRLDLRARTLSRNSEDIPLTAKEFDLLLVLLEHAGEEVAKVALVDQLWGADTTVDDRTLAQHISKLRKKLGNGSGTKSRQTKSHEAVKI